MSKRRDVVNRGGYTMLFCGATGAMEAVPRRGVYIGEGRYDIYLLRRKEKNL